MYKRNQLAHNIVFNVAADVFSSGFKCVTLEKEENGTFDSKVQQIYLKYVAESLFQCYLQARLYGSAGLLIGYDDLKKLDRPTKLEDKISYIVRIPHKWIIDKAPVKDQQGYTVLPLELAYYELRYLQTTSSKIDASRLVHLQPASIEDDFNGESSLFCIFDVLTILKNLDWSTGQAMFRHGAGLTTIIAGDGANQEQIDAIDEVVSEINVKTVLTLPPGCKKETDRPGALDPEKYYNVITAQIAGGSNIPLSIILGAQAGSIQASAKDRKDYGDFLFAIQNNEITPALTKLIKRFQVSKQLPDDDFLIEWNNPSTFVIDVARGKLYEARADHEQAKADLAKAELKRSQEAADAS